MSKITEQVKCWRYPCDGKVFEFNGFGFLKISNEDTIAKTKKVFTSFEYHCGCNKHCKPELITVTVERG